MQNASRIHRNFFRPKAPNSEAIATTYYYSKPKALGKCTVVDAWACAIAPPEPFYPIAYDPGE